LERKGLTLGATNAQDILADIWSLPKNGSKLNLLSPAPLAIQVGIFEFYRTRQKPVTRTLPQYYLDLKLIIGFISQTAS
jgi:hypothetical protein